MKWITERTLLFARFHNLFWISKYKGWIYFFWTCKPRNKLLPFIKKLGSPFPLLFRTSRSAHPSPLFTFFDEFDVSSCFRSTKKISAFLILKKLKKRSVWKSRLLETLHKKTGKFPADSPLCIDYRGNIHLLKRKNKGL